MPVGRPTKYKPEFCDKVIEVGKEGGSLAKMAVECGISMSNFQEWQKKHPDFQAAVKQGRLYSQVKWEENGMKGSFGELVGFNATAFIFQMKNRFPDDYREKQEVQHSVEENTLKDLIRGQRNG